MQDFKRHIKEAIELNSKRLPQYAKLTNNQSIPFSKKLIFYEKLILSTAWVVDMIGDRYQRKGVPFIIEDFVEMDLVPEFSEQFPKHIPFSSKLQKFDVNPIIKDLKKGITKKQEQMVLKITNATLEDLLHQPHVYCMTRHLIESIQRIAFLIPYHTARSEEIGIKPPTFYSWLLLRSHLSLLKKAIDFDENVAFIQEKGVPFLWQDLPPVDLINIYTDKNNRIKLNEP